MATATQPLPTQPAPAATYTNLGTINPPSPPANLADGGVLGQAALGALKGATEAHNDIPAPTQPIKMMNPAGEVGDVNPEKIDAARKAGYEDAIQMQNPSGETGWVRASKTQDAKKNGYTVVTAEAPTNETIGPAPSTTRRIASDLKPNALDIPTGLGTLLEMDRLGHAFNDLTAKIENYTQAGRAENPHLAALGDKIKAAKELLFGGQSAGQPLGTSSGILNNPVTAAISLGTPVATEGAEAAEARAAEKAESEIGEITEGHLTKAKPVPEPQHGTPVKTRSPLDSATITKQLGGKDLSPEAVKTLQSRQGDTIPIGSTAKNRMMADVEPNSEAINLKVKQMNQMVQSAPPMKTSVLQDDSIGLQNKIANLKSDLPKSVRVSGAEDIDDEVANAKDALNSTNVEELLEYRRKLGNKINWENIERNPTTPSEIVNKTRVTIYRAIGDKIHAEVPSTASVDAELSPNLELRSHYRNKLGDRAVDDPMSATVEAKSELRKGQQALAVEKHNVQVAKNWKTVGLVLRPLEYGALYEALRHLHLFE